MIIIRLIALAFWVLAALSLAGDVWTYMDTGEFTPLSLDKRWFDASSESRVLAQSIFERYVEDNIPILKGLWLDHIQSFLSWYAWAALSVLAAIFTVLSFRRRRRS